MDALPEPLNQTNVYKYTKLSMQIISKIFKNYYVKWKQISWIKKQVNKKLVQLNNELVQINYV